MFDTSLVGILGGIVLGVCLERIVRLLRQPKTGAK